MVYWSLSRFCFISCFIILKQASPCFAFSFSTLQPSSGQYESIYKRNFRVNRHVLESFKRKKSNACNRRIILTCKIEAPRAFSSNDWFENVKTLPTSKILLSIKSHMLFNTLWSVFVTVLHCETPQHYIDDFHISTVPHSIMASALALLLVFRSNASYDRYWEARKIWGNVTNTVRNLTRLAQSSFGEDKELFYLLVEYVKVFPWLLKQHLQDTRDDNDIDWLDLSDEEMEYLQSSPNPPLLSTQRMSQILEKVYNNKSMDNNTSIWYRMRIETEIGKLVDALGMCERILSTPVPRSYSRHTSRLLSVFLFTLPVVLVPHTEFATPFVVCLIAWGLLSIEAIAYYIEQPFNSRKQELPMASYCQKMKTDLERMCLEPPLMLMKTDYKDRKMLHVNFKGGKVQGVRPSYDDDTF